MQNFVSPEAELNQQPAARNQQPVTRIEDRPITIKDFGRT
jgi:hypothetical protein